MEKKPYIDFPALRERVRIVDVLPRYGVRLKPSGSNDSQFGGRCPLPSHTSKESRHSFFVNSEKNLFCCHSDSCKKAMGRDGGDVIDFVAAMERLTSYDAAVRLIEWFPIGTTKEPVVAQPVSPPMKAGVTTSALVESGAASNGAGVADKNKALGFRLKDVNPKHPMIQSRGITVETAKDWGVGFFPGVGSMKNRIVFPLHEDGEMIGYAGRTVIPVTPENPKWLMPKGLVKSFLYGLERCDPAHPLVLVEGCWPVLNFHRQGIQTAALLGSTMSVEQERRLAPYKTIWVMMDGDDAGRAATENIAARLKPRHNVLKAKFKE